MDFITSVKRGHYCFRLSPSCKPIIGPGSYSSVPVSPGSDSYCAHDCNPELTIIDRSVPHQYIRSPLACKLVISAGITVPCLPAGLQPSQKEHCRGRHQLQAGLPASLREEH